jgi:transcription initiation factor TFIIA small subunit
MSRNVAPVYSHYQHSPLGISLRETLQDLVDLEQLSEDQASRILQQFDFAINDAIKSHAKSKATIHSQLHTYRNCDNVWTFFLENAKVKLTSNPSDVVRVDKLKIIACDGVDRSKDKKK